jgi:hypothetical protein
MILDVDSLPLTPDRQVQIGRERLDAVSEPLDKVFRLTSRGLAGDCIHVSMFLARDWPHERPGKEFIDRLLFSQFVTRISAEREAVTAHRRPDRRWCAKASFTTLLVRRDRPGAGKGFPREPAPRLPARAHEVPATAAGCRAKSRNASGR